MIAPLFTVDLTERVAADADFVLSAEDVRIWVRRHGETPRRAFAALHIGWSRRWPDPAAANQTAAGLRRIPGWSASVPRFLCEVRDSVVCGHEAGDTDSPVLVRRGECPADTYIPATGRFQIKFLVRLEENVNLKSTPAGETLRRTEEGKS